MDLKSDFNLNLGSDVSPKFFGEIKIIVTVFQLSLSFFLFSCFFNLFIFELLEVLVNVIFLFIVTGKTDLKKL